RLHRHAPPTFEDLRGLPGLGGGRDHRSFAFALRLALGLALSLALPRSAGSHPNTVRAFSTSLYATRRPATTMASSSAASRVPSRRRSPSTSGRVLTAPVEPTKRWKGA